MQGLFQDIKKIIHRTCIFIKTMPILAGTTFLVSLAFNLIINSLAPYSQTYREGGVPQTILVNLFHHATSAAILALLITPLYGAVYDFYIKNKSTDGVFWNFLMRHYRLYFYIFAIEFISGVNTIYRPERDAHHRVIYPMASSLTFFLSIILAYVLCKLFFVTIIRSIEGNGNYISKSFALSKGNVVRIFFTKFIVTAAPLILTFITLMPGGIQQRLHTPLGLVEALGELLRTVTQVAYAVSVVVLYERLSNSTIQLMEQPLEHTTNKIRRLTIEGFRAVELMAPIVAFIATALRNWGAISFFVFLACASGAILEHIYSMHPEITRPSLIAVQLRRYAILISAAGIIVLSLGTIAMPNFRPAEYIINYFSFGPTPGDDWGLVYRSNNFRAYVKNNSIMRNNDEINFIFRLSVRRGRSVGGIAYYVARGSASCTNRASLSLSEITAFTWAGHAESAPDTSILLKNRHGGFSVVLDDACDHLSPDVSREDRRLLRATS